VSVTFQYGQTSVTLPGPVPGSAVRQVKRQVAGRTASGQLYTYDKGVRAFHVTLAFESLSDSEKASLVSFFHDSANGVMNSFTYTDSTGASFTARFASPEIALRKVAQNVWDASIELELNAMAG
jgi:hypothetical protein